MSCPVVQAIVVGAEHLLDRLQLVPEAPLPHGEDRLLGSFHRILNRKFSLVRKPRHLPRGRQQPPPGGRPSNQLPVRFGVK